jgi:hypothetical protein
MGSRWKLKSQLLGQAIFGTGHLPQFACVRLPDAACLMMNPRSPLRAVAVDFMIDEKSPIFWDDQGN